ncbi:MAG: hypothetical protein KC635_17315 [Myxococcales bacterium]|nr:hypothetical protein [Myxococcales bacterium]MCB9735895.1 hypothetical protein [Deltaproteobacteria bacterium]
MKLSLRSRRVWLASLALPSLLGASACTTIREQEKPADPPPVVAPEPEPPAPEPPKRPLEAMGYEGCDQVLVAGEDAPRGEGPAPAGEDGALATWPAPCAEIDGWAGVSHATWAIAGGFSKDGRTYFLCAGEGACTPLAVPTGKPGATVTAAGGMDDQNPDLPMSILSDKTVAKTVKKLGVTDASAAWPWDDVVVTWAAKVEGGTVVGVEYYLEEVTTRARVPIATLTGKASADTDQPLTVLAQPAQVAPGAKALAVRAITQEGQSLKLQVGLVSVKTTLPKLYAAAAEAAPERAAELTKKAKAAAK